MFTIHVRSCSENVLQESSIQTIFSQKGEKLLNS